MFHVPFRRSLFTLGVPLLAVAVIASLSIVSAAPSYAAPQQGKQTVTITNRCTIEGPQTLATVNNGDEVKGSAVVTGDDGTNEQEALVLYELNGSFSELIKANVGAKDFEFTAEQDNDQFVGCYTLIRIDDEPDLTAPDFFTVHQASVTFKVKGG